MLWVGFDHGAIPVWTIERDGDGTLLLIAVDVDVAVDTLVV